MLLDTLRQELLHPPPLSDDDDRRGPLIVVGYDGSPESRDAVELAAERAGPTGTVLVAHVLPAPGHLGTPYYERTLERSHLRAEELLRQLVERLPPSGASVETEVFRGDPADVLSRVAGARRAQEIVVGSRAVGRWRALLGSVSHALLRRADRPVLVVPSRAAAPTASGA
jgi:nucleotide-binding universal stress UspA family protein